MRLSYTTYFLTLLGEHHHALPSIVLVLNEMVLVLVLEGAVRIE